MSDSAMQERLTEVVKESGLTKAKFAERIGVSRQIVSWWLDGTYEPSVTSLVKIADEMGTTVDRLVGR